MKILEKKEGIDMAIRNWKEVGATNSRVGSARRSLKVAVLVRQQTLEEERQCTAAVQLLLADWVRRQLGCEREK